MLDYFLTEEQCAIRDLARSIADNEIRPVAAEHDPLAAYNAGPKTVEKTGAVPRIPETKEYVKKALSLYSGSPFAPVSSSGGGPQSSRQDPIFKVVSSDGSILFTNSPLYRKYPRF